ncbi:hypothetical protein [Eubacterium sp.]|uniref:hypothetical protein n=1 Tax=Eubacterium sp. TaxID=142586 RepID=UPI002FCC6675
MASLEERALENQWNVDAIVSKDAGAGLEEKVGVRKYRRLNTAIGRDLKALYDHRCQICGEQCGEAYGVTVAEAHHIDYFVESLNNDASNQMILCPNHHSIIHAAKPTFQLKEGLWVYPNGLREGLSLDMHLKESTQII